MTTSQVAAASQSIARALRGCARALRQVRKCLVLCKEKTLRDKVGVVVIIGTRANCIVKKERQKAERKCWNWALKTRPPKHGNFVTFLCMQRLPEWIIVTENFVLFAAGRIEQSDGFSERCTIIFRLLRAAQALFRRSFRSSVCNTSLFKLSVSTSFVTLSNPSGSLNQNSSSYPTNTTFALSAQEDDMNLCVAPESIRKWACIYISDTRAGHYQCMALLLLMLALWISNLCSYYGHSRPRSLL